MQIKKKLAARFPVLYRMRITQLRLARQLGDQRQGTRFAHSLVGETMTYACKRHQSLLRRKLGSSDPKLQENKITNLRVALKAVDGIVIRPGETFSFWKLVGRPTTRKGYIEGLMLSRGDVKTGVGGGLCQLANLLYWMALHTPLTITERHHHSFDPFPDEQRVLPFGSGASVFYNYVDLRFTNNTDQAFQFRVFLTDTHLKGSVHTDNEWPFTYHIQERNHRFLQQEGVNYRQNEIWQIRIDRRTGNVTDEKLVIGNFSEVRYALPQSVEVVEDRAVQSADNNPT